MSPELARSLVDENVGVLKRFVEGYLLNNGIAVQLVEAVAKKLLGAEVAAHGIVPDGYAAIPTQLVQTAVRSLVDITVIDPTVFKEG
ncbi:MAG TPA: hypothetical protein VFB59_03640, partial [Candidatus Saccharimonadales bacterium]|nr:hypothetical protein [Candidatus Saccharimonadales bacterium]